MRSDEIKLVLFDLGGVLVELGDELFPQSWFPDKNAFKLKDWFLSDAATKFETGQISSNDFVQELKQTLLLSASEDEIYDAFERWPKGFYAMTDILLERLKESYEVAVLSNTNEIHASIIMQKFGLENRVDNVFFSHLIGHAKPSEKAFEHVLSAVGSKPSEIIFFDDINANVQAARMLGMRAHQVSSPSDVAQYI